MKKRITSFIFAICLLLFNTVNISANETSHEFDQDYILSLNPPTAYIDLNQEDNKLYSSSVQTTSITTISCFLVPHINGRPEMYHIYISWVGGNQVQSIQASSLQITNSSILSPITYYNSSFFVQGLSSTQGSSLIGGCTIPTSTNTVRIKTTDLSAYFYNRDYWIRMNEINGLFNL